MRTPARTAALLLALALPTSLARAQGDTGFLRGEGRLDTVLSYTLDWYDEFWVGDMKVSDPGVGEVERETYTLYAAYGLTNDIDLVLNASYVEAETDGTVPFDDEDDLQDLYLGAKWRAWSTGIGTGMFSALLAPSVKIPMTDYEDNDVTAIGDGQVDLRFRGILHYQVSAFFGSLESGYDVRNGAPEDEVPLNITVGGTIADRVTLMPFYSLVRSEGGPDIGDPGFRFRAVEEEYDRIGISVYARIAQGFGLSAMWRTTTDGMNTGEAETISVGLVYGAQLQGP
ncbi:MAG TPA: transporter [Planctomycetota bacterium]